MPVEINLTEETVSTAVTIIAQFAFVTIVISALLVWVVSKEWVALTLATIFFSITYVAFDNTLVQDAGLENILATPLIVIAFLFYWSWKRWATS